MLAASARKPLSFAFALIVAFAVVFIAACPPSPKSEDVPADVFSASRAMMDVRIIAQKPHPIGSDEIERVRLHIVSRLEMLGLTAVVHDQPVPQGRHAPWLEAQSVRNIVAVLPGQSPDLPAIVLMSHYDTAPGSPGAADDSAGVAAMLEIAGNLQQAGRLKRDVIFLFTDGEEAGLLGSRLWFADDANVKRAGLVLNLEARGASGRTFMFETNSEAGGLIEVFSNAVQRPSANSLMALVYRNMPNGTDLTSAFKRGVAGMNFAFIGDEAAYHTPIATPERLNAGSLQHMGEQALALTRAFTSLPQLPARADDLVYSDVLGLFLIAYPVSAGWVLVAICAALLAFAMKRAHALDLTPLRETLAGAGLFLAILLAPAMLLFALGLAIGILRPEVHASLLTHYGVFASVSVVLVLVMILLVLVTGRRLAPWAVWVGGCGFALVLLIALQISVPLVAFLLAWPLLLTLIAMAVMLQFGKGRLEGSVFWMATFFLCLPAAILALQWGQMLFAGVGALLPAILAVPGFLAALALPLAQGSFAPSRT